MFSLFFKKLFFVLYLFLAEVLRFSFRLFSFLSSFFVNFGFLFSFFPVSLWSDEITYYFFSYFFDFLFFSHSIQLNFFYLPHYLFFSFFSFIQFYFGNFLFYSSSVFSFFLFGFFLLGFLFFLFFFFCIVSFVLNFYDFLFKSKLAGLLLFSRDFLSVEDEDLWVSSHIFYFDNRIIESKEFKIPLTSEEIEVFSTIVRIFFDIPSKNSEYYAFSNQLMLFKSDFQKHLDNKRDQGFDIIDNIYFQARKKKQLPTALSNFFSLFITKNDFNDLRVNQNDSFLNQKLNSRIYYPSFFTFLFHLINFNSPTSKFRKLNIHQQNKVKHQYLKFKKKFSFKRDSKLKKLFSSSFANPINTEISIQQKSQAKVNLIIASNRKAFIKHFLNIKKNLEFFVPSQKISLAAFSYFRQQNLYNDLNNKIRLQRFRRFFWISFPFYVLETSNLFYFSFVNNKFLLTFYSFYKTLLSKFLYSLFWLFGDDSNYELNLLFEHNISNYNPNIKFNRSGDNFLNFIKTKRLSSQSISEIFQSFLNIDSYLFKQDEYDLKINKINDTFFKSESLVDDLKIILDSSRPFASNIRKDFQKLKKEIAEEREERFTNFLGRKLGTLKRQNLILSSKYTFSNKYNSKSYFFHPKIELIDFYKLLEYFYFVITNDVNFYENAQFNAKVEILRQKYGQAIVSDMLDTSDHKQAKKVSVQLHIVDYDLDQQKSNLSAISDSEKLMDVSREYNDNDASKTSIINLDLQKFKRKSVLKSKSNIDNFTDDLILSYKYRFKK